MQVDDAWLHVDTSAPPQTERSPPMVRVSRRSGIAFVPVICALFLLVGAGLLVAGGLQLAKARSSTSWPTVTGTVLTSTVE